MAQFEGEPTHVSGKLHSRGARREAPSVESSCSSRLGSADVSPKARRRVRISVRFFLLYISYISYIYVSYVSYVYLDGEFIYLFIYLFICLFVCSG